MKTGYIADLEDAIYAMSCFEHTAWATVTAKCQPESADKAWIIFVSQGSVFFDREDFYEDHPWAPF